MAHPQSQDTDEFVDQAAAAARFLAPPGPPVRVEFGALSHPGLVRSTNEDHYVIVRRSRRRRVLATNLPAEALTTFDEADAYAFAVADGIGGMAFGEVASMLALQTAWELGAHEVQWPLRVNAAASQEILEKFEAYAQLLHSKLCEAGRDDPRLAGMGTTLTVAYTVGLDAFLAHLGDSRGYLFRQGKLEQLTRDHTLGQQLVDAGVFSPEALEVRRLRHVLLNCLGADADSVRVDTDHRKLQSGDWLLLCSDGLTDMVDNATIGSILRGAATSDEACHTLVATALANGGKDNVTVALARYRFPQ